jgi:AcrR family transcriptional regulator
MGRTSPARPPRRYDSSRRQARAAENRRRVVRAAHDLFVTRGFAATTVAAIAESADVSVPTVYDGFGSKAELLKQAIDVALAGDDQAVAVAERPTAQWVDEADTAEELLSRFAVMMGELAERAAPIFDVLIRAADIEPELADLLERFEAQRLTAATRIAGAVRDRGGLPPERSLDHARDVIWLCMAPDLYTMLVTKRGWSRTQYVDWARHALAHLVRVAPTGESG